MGLEQNAPAARNTNRRAWVILIVWVLGVLVSLALLLVWPYAMSSYDEGHKRALQCHVESAEKYSGSTSSRTGLEAPVSYIRVDTENCGTLVLQRVPTDRQQLAVAAELDEGGRFEFNVGASSYWFRDSLKLINRFPTAFDYKSLSK